MPKIDMIGKHPSRQSWQKPDLCQSRNKITTSSLKLINLSSTAVPDFGAGAMEVNTLRRLIISNFLGMLCDMCKTILFTNNICRNMLIYFLSRSLPSTFL